MAATTDRGSHSTSPGPRDRRVAWAVTIGAGVAMLLVPVAFAVLLSADGGGGPTQAGAATTDGQATRSKTDRVARVTFHLRPGSSLGMRILGKAPRETRLIRGRKVRIVCGSVSGLRTRTARWPRGEPTLRVELPAPVYANAEFCGIKRGRASVARVVFD